MKVVTLASGSKGNCTYIESDKLKILLDAGISMVEIERRLHQVGVEAKDINAILITHEHSDHLKSAKAFAKKYGASIIASEIEWQILEEKFEGLDISQKVSFSNHCFILEDVKIKAFELSHDSFTCFGYSFYNGGNKISIATDLGHAPQSVINELKGSSLVILEANHDEKLLLNNPKYSVSLKNRILSRKGHLSNLASAEVIKQLVGTTKQVVLAHLSEENNSPELAYNTVRNILYQDGIIEGEHIFIDVSTQEKVGNLFNLTSKN